MKVGILISGRGSNMRSLLEAKSAGKLPAAEFVLVFSNDPDAPGLQIAREHGVPTEVVNHKDFGKDRAAYEKVVLEKLRAADCEALVLAGYMRIVGETLLSAFPNRIINIHPALLPSFPGLHAQRQALEHGVRVSGCTVHFADSGVDSGPIILQKAVPVEQDDTEDSLSERILVEEHRLIVEAADLLTRGRLRVEGRRVVIT